MSIIRIKKGLTLPLAGKPEPQIVDAPRPATVALQPPDFRYLRPRLKVAEGDAVKTGTVLLEDKDDPRVVFVSPGSGKIASVHYGERRRILEVVVELSAEEEFVEHGKFDPEDARGLSREKIIESLLSAGLWPLIRQRPYSRIARPDDKPKAVFISATPVDPFDADPNAFLTGKEEAFQLGLDILAILGDGRLHLGIGAEARVKALTEAKNCRIHRFSGPYPSGNPAVQIYHTVPPAAGDVVWFVGAQDVLAIADFFTTGRFPVSRIYSVSGYGAKDRRYFKSRLGASVESLTQGGVEAGELRYISGGPLTGRKISATGYMGFYDTMLYVVPEGRGREMLGFVRPGTNRFSSTNAFLSALLPGKKFSLDTNKRGSVRNFVLNGVYEDVCAVDILPQHLVKSILAGDIEENEKHGILDCAECGLCTFVCPSKIELGEIIRQGLDAIMKESA